MAAQVGEIVYNRADCIKSGQFSNVFRGTFQISTKVAVKRTVKLNSGIDAIAKIILAYIKIFASNPHPNLVRYFAFVEDQDFW